MKTIYLTINNNLEFSFDLESEKAFYRHRREIEEMCETYLFEFNSEQTMTEIKNKILQILSTDIQNIRKNKLKKIDESCGIKSEQKMRWFDIKFEITSNKLN